MKIFRFAMSVALVAVFGCQSSSNKTEGQDSLRTDSSNVAESNPSSLTTTASSSYELPVLTFGEVPLYTDSAGVTSTETVKALTPVKIIEQTTEVVGEECGSYVYHVQLPDSREGWIMGYNLAFPGTDYSFVGTTMVTLAGLDYTVFSLTQGGEISGMECDNPNLVLIYSHSEDSIYTIGITDPELNDGVRFGLDMRIGTANTLEFYRTMSSPDMNSVRTADGLIELELKLSYMDNTSRTYRLFVEKGDNAFNIIRYMSEDAEDNGGGN